MIRKSIASTLPIYMSSEDKRKCLCIANFVLLQCVIVILASMTIFYCVWKPNLASFDYYKLASIMYLFDKKECGYNLAAKSITNLRLSNDTRGLNVLPILCKPAIVTVATRLSSKTRKYVKLSLGIHVVWMLMAIVLRIIIKNSRNSRLHKCILSCFLYMFIFVTLFDLSMAIVYVAHIKQSLTKNMIVRYSGWSVILELENREDFAGWLPMIASGCWMRGVIILALNIYCCQILRRVRNKVKKIESRSRYVQEGNLPIPEARRESRIEDNVLYFRPGELQPYVKKGHGGYMY